ncbi:MAG: iron-containing alcohol dehydrogenase [Planctomycetia bacterium]|nr:iron-containing alcohol dehydrogenase [Planctomycetia bacterium]
MIDRNYEFITPGKIIFGWGRRMEIASHAKMWGTRIHLICGSRTLYNNGEISQIMDSLLGAGFLLESETYQHGEPTVTDVDTLTEKLIKKGISREKGDILMAIGGGSAIDLAKAVSAMVVNWNIEEKSSVKDFLENVGRGFTLERLPLPVVAVPTTAGTGAEATKNAVIASYAPAFKKSLRADFLVPRVAVVDPELTVSNPPDITAACGMDTITQLMESFISRKARPIPQSLALQGMRLGMDSLESAVKDGSNRIAREKMAHAALLSGMCLANSGLGMVHGIAPALGTHARIPHGLACAILLPAALRINADVSQERLALLSSFLFPNSYFANNKDAVETLLYEVNMLCNAIGIPRRLSELGVTQEQLPVIVADSRGSSMSGNPRELSNLELMKFLSELM